MQIDENDYNTLITNEKFQKFLIDNGYKTIKKVDNNFVETVLFPSKDKIIELSALYLTSEITDERNNLKKNRKIAVLILIAVLIFFIFIGYLLGILFFD